MKYLVETVTYRSTGRSIWLCVGSNDTDRLTRSRSSDFHRRIDISRCRTTNLLNDSAIFPNPINIWLSTGFDRIGFNIGRNWAKMTGPWKNEPTQHRFDLSDLSRHRQTSHNIKCTRIRCNGRIHTYLIIEGFMTQLCL